MLGSTGNPNKGLKIPNEDPESIRVIWLAYVESCPEHKTLRDCTRNI
jgi:hypothetical protein